MSQSPFARRLVWFVALWIAGVAVLGLAGAVIRLAMKTL